jgi:arginyl-tRNA synthetase
MFRSLLSQRLIDAFASAQIDVPVGFSPSVVLASDTRFGDYQSNTGHVTWPNNCAPTLAHWHNPLPII